MLTNIEPRVFRQRLIVEGHYRRSAMDGEVIRDYLISLSSLIEMRVFAGPYSWPPDPWDHPEVPLHELNGFVAWTESGCHVYAWRPFLFFTVDVYSCKTFNTSAVVDFTKDFFQSTDAVFVAF
ncbi:MAG: S-adenosylmethionine decarboxylase [Deltaproteobacteria bacterium]|nr:S-adenosylmethionine decarboxylase [Deltaproteobacteria bacterium]